MKLVEGKRIDQRRVQQLKKTIEYASSPDAAKDTEHQKEIFNASSSPEFPGY